MENIVHIPHGNVKMEGMLAIPEGAQGLVLFVHGSGSSRLSPRNRFVADVLNEKGQLATLLIDLLSKEEEAVYETRFDIDLLTKRLETIVQWLEKQPETKGFLVGLFGSSTGAAAALKLAAAKGKKIYAVVSRGGRPDLALGVLNRVVAPTLLIVGGDDAGVIELNQQAYERLSCPKQFTIIPHATHLFEEPGCLEQVAAAANQWFLRYLSG